MQRIGGGVDALVERSVDAEGEVVVDVVGETLPLEDELDDARPRRLAEEVRPVGVEPATNYSFLWSIRFIALFTR